MKNEQSRETTVFKTALEKANPAARKAYVADACGDDETLRRRVEQLIQESEDALFQLE